MKKGTAKKRTPIFCLYHKTYNCICIKPVTDEETLKMRIEHQKRLDELNEKYRRLQEVTKQ